MISCSCSFMRALLYWHVTSYYLRSKSTMTKCNTWKNQFKARVVAAATSNQFNNCLNQKALREFAPTLTLTSESDLSTQNQTTSLLGYHKFIPYTKFEYFGIITFWIMQRISVWNMHLFTPWPWPFNPKTKLLLGPPKAIPFTKLEHFGTIHFWVML